MQLSCPTINFFFSFKEKWCPQLSRLLNDAESLMRDLERRREKDPRMVTDVGLGEDDTLQYLFLQTGDMRDTFSKFPEHVCVDCTYSLNDRDMPLLSFLVVDGNSRSRLVGFAFIINETAQMLDRIFSVFKSNNSASHRIQTFMVDKDLNGISRLEHTFPQALCELCIFHVKKAMRKKIAELSCESDVKHNIKAKLESLCNARSESEYEGIKEELVLINEDFAQYFNNNWDNMRERWTQYAREDHLNFGDTTNNRIESYHQKLKSVIKSPLALDVCCKKLLFVHDLLLEETTHQQFTGITKRSQSAFPELQKTVTPHALKLVQGEVHKSRNYDVLHHNTAFYVRSKINQNSCYEVSEDECTCRTFRNMLLPCRHIVAVRHAQGKKPLEPSLFRQRWLISYNWGCPPDPSLMNGESSVSTFDWRSRAMERKDRYALAKGYCDKLLHKLVELGEQRLQYYLGLLEVFEEKVSACERFEIVGEGQAGANDGQAGANVVVVDRENLESDGLSDLEDELPTPNDSFQGDESNEQVQEMNVSSVSVSVVAEDDEEECFQEVADCNVRLARIKPPLKLGKRGRPKGFGLTALGLPRKKKVKTGPKPSETGSSNVQEHVMSPPPTDTVVNEISEDHAVSNLLPELRDCSVNDEEPVCNLPTISDDPSIMVVDGDITGLEIDGQVVELVLVDAAKINSEASVDYGEDNVNSGTVTDLEIPSLHREKRTCSKRFSLSRLGLSKMRKILKNKCNKCKKDDPDKDGNEGPTNWIGCEKCDRWFHSVCINDAAKGSENFVCNFCQ